MDINAGQLLDGMPMNQLGADTFRYLVKVASGQPSKGELAGHHQVQIWRNWAKTPGDEIDAQEQQSVTDAQAYLRQASTLEAAGARLLSATDFSETDGPRQGVPLAMRVSTVGPALISSHPLNMLPAVHDHHRFTTEHIALLVPTSLCSSQVSKMLAERVALTHLHNRGAGPLRVLALPHTEGCGHSAGASEEMFVRTMLNYACHPMVAMTVLVEHGCEKTHNDRMAATLRRNGVDPARFGYASIQLDGGIEAVHAKVNSYFQSLLSTLPTQQRQPCPLGTLHIGLLGQGTIPPSALQSLSRVAMSVLQLGGTCVTIGSALEDAHFLNILLGDGQDYADTTLGYGQVVATPGLHRMHCTSQHLVELSTGLGASGVDIIVALIVDHVMEVSSTPVQTRSVFVFALSFLSSFLPLKPRLQLMSTLTT